MKTHWHDAAQRGGIFAKLTVLIVIVLLCAALYLVRLPLLRVMGSYWIVGAAASNADAIVILSDDDFTADRAARAAELYHSGWAQRVVASGRWLRPYASIAELMQHDLETRGVPKKAILPFAHDAPDTLEELRDINDFVQKHHWKQIIIVTSSYHTRRTRYLARHIFPRTIEVQIISAPDVNYDPDSWWRTREGLKIYLHETLGMVVAMWEVHHLKPRTIQDELSGKASAQFPSWKSVRTRIVYTPMPLYYSS